MYGIARLDHQTNVTRAWSSGLPDKQYSLQNTTGYERNATETHSK